MTHIIYLAVIALLLWAMGPRFFFYWAVERNFEKRHYKKLTTDLVICNPATKEELGRLKRGLIFTSPGVRDLDDTDLGLHPRGKLLVDFLHNIDRADIEHVSEPDFVAYEGKPAASGGGDAHAERDRSTTP